MANALVDGGVPESGIEVASLMTKTIAASA